MKNWKQKISFIGLFLILFCTILAVKTEYVQAASGYQLSRSQSAVKLGETGSNYLGRPSGDSWQDLKSKKIKWYSTNNNIAKITYKDYWCDYKGVRPGICYICAKFKGKTYKCKVVVYNARKSNIKNLKIGMKGCINNSYYYSYGCRIYNPNDFAVETTLYAKVKTKRGARLANDSYKDICIPAKGYKYIANYGDYDEDEVLKNTSVKVTYRFSPKKPDPISIYYDHSLAIPAKKAMKVTKLSIRKRPSEYYDDGYYDVDENYHSVKKEIKNDYYDVKYKFKNNSKKVLSWPATEIFFIKNKKVMGSFIRNNTRNMDPGEKVSESDSFKWPFKRWTRVVVVNYYFW